MNFHKFSLIVSFLFLIFFTINFIFSDTSPNWDNIFIPAALFVAIIKVGEFIINRQTRR